MTSPGVICEPRLWVSGEYLMWWVKSGPLPVPLVTSGSNVLVGDNSINYGMFSGLRLTVGGWLDPGQNFGLEGSGFGLFNNSNNFLGSSNAMGVPPLNVPVVNAMTGGTFSVGSSLFSPLGLPTLIGESSSSQFWGWEANGVINLFRSGVFHAEGLVGFRYLDLAENLNLQVATAKGLPPGVFPPPFDMLPGVATANLTDGFSTRNQFYGANFGVRGGVRYGRVSFDGTFKLAMGPMHEVEQVVGFKTATASAGGFSAVATAPGGIFAQPTNGGRQTDNTFAVVPEVIFRLSVDITQHWKVFVGYNFIYLSDVIRPGNQIDPVVNISQFTGPLVGTARPAAVFNHNDFWAQGINFGAEFTW